MSSNNELFKDYGKTLQFRNVVKDARSFCKTFNVPLPVVDFVGTVKLHGTNAAVGIKDGQIYCQSRKRIITPEDDNMGFARFVEDNKDFFAQLLKDAANQYDSQDVLLYGEWCGKGIQKGVGISEVPKMFVVFEISTDKGIHCPSGFNLIPDTKDIPVYNIFNFGAYHISVDFSNPDLAANTLSRITDEVEKSCPAAKYFGVDGVGEGVVWRGNFNGIDLKFKVKGDKHSVSKVKKIATVDPEVLENIQQFVEYAATNNRLEQGLQEVGLDQKSIGKFIGWVNKDIYEEEKDVLDANNLSMKQVGSKIADVARNYYLDKLNSL